jgi:hypothetical protein
LEIAKALETYVQTAGRTVPNRGLMSLQLRLTDFVLAG